MKTQNDLPLFQLEIDDDIEGTGLIAISLVKNPAIQVPFFKFSENIQLSTDDRQIVTGAVLIPNQLIYRNEPYPCNVKFSPDQVEEIVQRFHKTGNNNKVTLEHALSIQGADIMNLWLSDEQMGIQPPRGFESLPDKTLFASYKINDASLWNSIKSGEFTGFSLEGFSNMLPIKMSRELNEFEI